MHSFEILFQGDPDHISFLIEIGRILEAVERLPSVRVESSSPPFLLEQCRVFCLC